METLDILAVPRPVTSPAKVPATLVPATIKDTVLAQFREEEAGLLILAEKYRAVVYPVATTLGMAAAKAARLELREKGRYAVQRAETRIKAEVNDLKRVMSDEAERLIAIVQPVEEAIDAQIKAREKALADEKAERERLAAEAAAKEAARVKMHRDNIAKIRGYVAQAQGASAAKLQAAVEFVAALTFSEEWQEFQAEAAAARDETMTTLLALRDAALAREAEAARVKAQAEENARVAAELAEQRKQLEAEAAALKKQAEEAEAAQAVNARLAEALNPTGDFVALPVTPPPAIEPPVQPINRSTRKAITAEPATPSVDTATPAELRNEWALFLEALQRVEPAIKKHAAFVDHTRYIRALDRFAGLFV